MKNNILNALTLVAFVFYGYSQDFQGKAIYESKTQVDMNFNGRQMSEDRKKEIMERMKRANERTYVLTFDRTESLYEEEQELEQPGGRGGGRGMRFGSMGSAGGNLYKNIKEGKYLTKNELFGKIFLIEDQLEKLDWKMEDDTKQIGNYTAFKATATKTIKRPNIRAVFGRRNQESQEDRSDEFIEKEVEIVAWYTPEIPVNQGPSGFWGLPGLILAVSDDITTIACSKIIMNPKEKIEIKAPSKGKKVTQAEYDEISREKMKEMRDRFRNGRNRDRGNF